MMERTLQKGYFRRNRFSANMDSRFWYSIWDDNTTILDAHVNHYGIKSNLQKLINTDIGFDFSKNFEKTNFMRPLTSK